MLSAGTRSNLPAPLQDSHTGGSEGLDEFQHEMVEHAAEQVLSEVHTNGLENFRCF